MQTMIVDSVTPLYHYIIIFLQKNGMNVLKPDFPACMIPSLETPVEVALVQPVLAQAPSTQVGFTCYSEYLFAMTVAQKLLNPRSF